MKIILFFSGILLSLALDAQDTTKSSTDTVLDSLIIQANSLLKDKLTDSAQVIIAKAALWTMDHHGLNSKAYAEICSLYGKLNQQKNNHPETVKWFQQAISIRKELLGSEDTLYASALHQLGAEYDDKNMNNLALDLYSEALAIRQKVYGKLHPDYLSTLSGLAFIYSQLSDFKKAEEAYLEVKNCSEQLYGKNHLDYAKSIQSLGIFYQRIAQYDRAELLLLEAKAIRESISGKSSKVYFSSVGALAYLYATMEKYDQAEMMYSQGLTEWENKFDKIDDQYIRFTLGLALMYVKTSQYSKAEPLLMETLRIREKIQGKLHPYYIWELAQLADLYLNTGQYEKAEKLYKEKLNISEILYGNLSAGYSNDLMGLANLYNTMGQNEKAEPLYLKAIQIKEKTIGTNDLNYAGALGNLAILYLHTGLYEKAEKLLFQNLAIVQNKVGSDHINMIFPLTNLALVYDRLGLYEKSIELKIKVNKLIATYYSEKHPYHATGLHNLATSYTNIGRYGDAIQLFKSVLPLRKELLGESHHDYATSLLGISMAYLANGQYPEAFVHANEARNIMKDGVGTLHPHYVHCLNILGKYYQRTAQYETAETYFTEARMLSEQVHGADHYNTILYSNNLATIYMKLKQYEKARILIESNTVLHQSQVAKGLYHLSEEELDQYLSSTEDYQANLYSMASNYQIETSTPTPLIRLCYDNVLFYKGFLLQSAQRILRIAEKTPESAETYTQLKSYRRRLAKEYALPVAARDSITIADFELRSNALEKALAGELKGFRESLLQVQTTDVQKQLKPGEVCIEFIHYMNYEGNFTDSIYYAALILRPGNNEPTLISLFEEKELQEILQNKTDRRADYVNDLYAYAERGMVKLGKSKRSLYELIWQKLEMQGLSEVHTIYFALSGELHRINLGAIPINETEMLSDKYNLIILNSTRQLIEMDSIRKVHQPGLAILFSDIEFDVDTSKVQPNPVTGEMDHIASRGPMMNSAGDLEGQVMSWSALQWTAKEGRLIEEILTETKHPVQHFKKTDASEEKFKQMGSTAETSPKIIHLATHGYFFSDPEVSTSGIDVSSEPVFISSENPMIRSGLIMAGGNYAWKNGKPVNAQTEDGILTAYEISQLDLSNTELVVLSACETGLGDIHGNEGVYGLQRAFKIAGARYLIMSLWKVPDRESGEFMTAFYRNWLEQKLTIPEAFRKTQREMRDRFFNPYSWAAFVLVE